MPKKNTPKHAQILSASDRLQEANSFCTNEEENATAKVSIATSPDWHAPAWPSAAEKQTHFGTAPQTPHHILIQSTGNSGEVNATAKKTGKASTTAALASLDLSE